jgi:hypothetical protein
MPLPPDQLEELRKYYSDVAEATEAGVPYALIRKASMPPGCNPAVMDVLLCPYEQNGYPSRLYFESRVECPPKPGRNLNWSGTARILERNWAMLSWRIPGGTSQRLVQMVQSHLEALR